MNTTIKNIAACAGYIRDIGQIDHINSQWYHSCVSSKKGLIGIGLLFASAAQSRSSAESCGFSFCAPSFGGSNVGPQGRLLTASAGAQVDQPVRAATPIGLGVAVVKTAPQEAIMAQSPSMGAPALIASDLIVRIQPNLICRYYGTSAQLLAEGLIPACFQWPQRARRTLFEDSRFEYWLQRDRVPGTKGPMSSWIDGDYWVLDVSCKGYRYDWATVQIKEKLAELAAIKRRCTPEWEREFSRAYAARCDSKYMQFRAFVLGDMAPRKRGRPANSPTQTQGAANV